MCPDKGIFTRTFHNYGQVIDHILSPAVLHPLSLDVRTSAVSGCCDVKEMNFRARIILGFSDSKSVLTAFRLGAIAFRDDELKSIFKSCSNYCAVVVSW